MVVDFAFRVLLAAIPAPSPPRSQATHTYRRDGWRKLLLASLLQLRDCCQRLKLHREALLHSLEASCLPHGLGAQQGAAAAAAAIASIAAGAGDRKSSILKPGSPVAADAAAGALGRARPFGCARAGCGAGGRLVWVRRMRVSSVCVGRTPQPFTFLAAHLDPCRRAPS